MYTSLLFPSYLVQPSNIVGLFSIVSFLLLVVVVLQSYNTVAKQAAAKQQADEVTLKTLGFNWEFSALRKSLLNHGLIICLQATISDVRKLLFVLLHPQRIPVVVTSCRLRL